MIVIANSGPLMALAKLGLVDLFEQLYGRVRVPGGVYTEVVERGRERGYPEVLPIQLAIQRGHLEVVLISNAELSSDLSALSLDMGEKQVLHLAIRDKADLLLLDDLKAREEAQSRGMNVKGTMGVIIQAYRRGLLSFNEVETIVDTIIDRDDIWIAEELAQRVLAELKAASSVE